MSAPTTDLDDLLNGAAPGLVFRDIARVLEREARSLRLGATLSAGNTLQTAGALNEAARYMRDLADIRP